MNKNNSVVCTNTLLHTNAHITEKQQRKEAKLSPSHGAKQLIVIYEIVTFFTAALVSHVMLSYKKKKTSSTSSFCISVNSKHCIITLKTVTASAQF